jgi:hypothetical protein
MDALAEANADAKEINDAVQANNTAGELIDETEIEDELAALVRGVEEEALSKKLADVQLETPQAKPEDNVVSVAQTEDTRLANTVISPS